MIPQSQTNDNFHNSSRSSCFIAIAMVRMEQTSCLSLSLQPEPAGSLNFFKPGVDQPFSRAENSTPRASFASHFGKLISSPPIGPSSCPPTRGSGSGSGNGGGIFRLRPLPHTISTSSDIVPPTRTMGRSPPLLKTSAVLDHHQPFSNHLDKPDRKLPNAAAEAVSSAVVCRCRSINELNGFICFFASYFAESY